VQVDEHDGWPEGMHNRSNLRRVIHKTFAQASVEAGLPAEADTYVQSADKVLRLGGRHFSRGNPR
jgi:hypothetical protein